MKRVFLVDESRREPVLTYNPDLGLAYYAHEVLRIILPSSNKKLLEHFTEFSTFLDTLNTEITLHYFPDPSLVTTTATTTTSTTTTTTTTKPVEPKPFRPWYEVEETSEEETADVMGEGENEIQPEPEPVIDQPSYIDSIDLTKLCHIAWEWHNDVIHRKREVFTSFYAYSYMLSWVSFCRLFYMNIIKNKEKHLKYSQTALDSHEYTEKIRFYACIVVNSSTLREYSLEELWETLGHLVPTMYHVQYTGAMKEYVHMLLFRYSTFLSCFFPDEEGEVLFSGDPSFVSYSVPKINQFGEQEEEEEEEEETQIDDNEIFTETFDEYKSLTIQVSPSYSLRSRYLLEGELLFYSQLMRINLSSRFQALPLMNLAYNRHPGNYSDILMRCLLIICEMNSQIISNKVLRYETGEQFKTCLSHIHLYHGQKELFTRLWPGSGNEPGDVIEKFRPNDNLKIAETRRMAVPMICNAYLSLMQSVIMGMKETLEKATNGVQPRLYPFPCVDYEREMVALTKICTIEWLNYGALGNVSDLKKAFIIEETSSLEEIDQILILHRMRQMRKQAKQPVAVPYLVKLIQIYYIIDINGDTVQSYATHFFVEAYFVWLALCFKYKLVPMKLFHEKTQPMIKSIHAFL